MPSKPKPFPDRSRLPAALASSCRTPEQMLSLGSRFRKESTKSSAEFSRSEVQTDSLASAWEAQCFHCTSIGIFIDGAGKDVYLRNRDHERLGEVCRILSQSSDQLAQNFSWVVTASFLHLALALFQVVLAAVTSSIAAPALARRP